ncbi:MAG: hypothetical protein E6L09_02190, partial [Verrucomicrobia bacterium]
MNQTFHSPAKTRTQTSAFNTQPHEGTFLREARAQFHQALGENAWTVSHQKAGFVRRLFAGGV